MDLRIFAIDASSVSTGWSVLDHDGRETLTLMDCGEIKLSKGFDAYVDLFNELTRLLKHHKPNRIVLEDTYLSNTKTLKMLERIRGVVILACVINGYDNIEQINASSARKRVFDDGKITKEDVCKRLSAFFNYDLKTKGFDQSDATCLGIAAHKINIKKNTDEVRNGT